MLAYSFVECLELWQGLLAFIVGLLAIKVNLNTVGLWRDERVKGKLTDVAKMLLLKRTTLIATWDGSTI